MYFVCGFGCESKLKLGINSNFAFECCKNKVEFVLLIVCFTCKLDDEGFTRGKKKQLRKTSTAFAANPRKIGRHHFTSKAKRRAGMWKYKMAHGLETCSHSSEFQFPSRTGPSLGRAVLQPAWYIGQRCGSLPAGPSPRVPPRWPRGCAKTQIQAILLGLWRETFPASLSRAVQGDPSPQLTADGK